MNIFEEIAKATISMGLVTIVLQFIFNRRLESYKTKQSKELEAIRQENQHFQDRSHAAFSIEIERARASYSGLYMKRLETIETCNENLVDLLDALQKYTKIIELEEDGTKDERNKTVLQLAKKFRKHYLRKRIFLTNELEMRIDRVMDDISSVVIKFFTEVHGHEFNRGAVDKWLEISDTVDKDIHDVLDQLRRGMRDVLDPPNQWLDSEKSD